MKASDGPFLRAHESAANTLTAGKVYGHILVTFASAENDRSFSGWIEHPCSVSFERVVTGQLLLPLVPPGRGRGVFF